MTASDAAGFVLPPRVAGRGRTRDLLRARLALKVEDGMVIACDGRGREHVYPIGQEPRGAASLAVVAQLTPRRSAEYLTVLDAVERPLVVSDLSLWDETEARHFAARAGLGFTRVRFNDWAAYNQWRRYGNTEPGGAEPVPAPVNLDATAGSLLPLYGFLGGWVAGIGVAVAGAEPAVVWILGLPVVGLVVPLVVDRVAGRPH